MINKKHIKGRCDNCGSKAIPLNRDYSNCSKIGNPTLCYRCLSDYIRNGKLMDYKIKGVDG